MTERDCRLHQVIRGWTWLAAARVGSPGNKPIIVESDHAGSNKDAAWVWQMSTRGYSVGDHGRQIVPRSELFRLGQSCRVCNKIIRLGVAEPRDVAQMLSLNGMAPYDHLASTGYVLADPAAGQYAPHGAQFRVNLSGFSATLKLEWVNVYTGSSISGGTVHPGIGAVDSTYDL